MRCTGPVRLPSIPRPHRPRIPCGAARQPRDRPSTSPQQGFSPPFGPPPRIRGFLPENRGSGELAICRKKRLWARVVSNHRPLACEVHLTGPSALPALARSRDFAGKILRFAAANCSAICGVFPSDASKMLPRLLIGAGLTASNSSAARTGGSGPNGPLQRRPVSSRHTAGQEAESNWKRPGRRRQFALTGIY